MIELGQWYKCKSKTDTKNFLNEAMEKWPSLIPFIISNDLESKEGFKIVNDPIRVYYRSKADNVYNGENIEYKLYVKGDNNMCKHQNSQLNANNLSDALVCKYYEQEVAAIEEKITKEINKVYRKNAIGMKLKALNILLEEKGFKPVDFDAIAGFGALSKDEQDRVKALQYEIEEKTAKAYDKAFECCALLEKTRSYTDYQQTLQAYGYIQNIPNNQSSESTAADATKEG